MQSTFNPDAKDQKLLFSAKNWFLKKHAPTLLDVGDLTDSQYKQAYAKLEEEFDSLQDLELRALKDSELIKKNPQYSLEISGAACCLEQVWGELKPNDRVKRQNLELISRLPAYTKPLSISLVRFLSRSYPYTDDIHARIMSVTPELSLIMLELASEIAKYHEVPLSSKDIFWHFFGYRISKEERENRRAIAINNIVKTYLDQFIKMKDIYELFFIVVSSKVDKDVIDFLITQDGKLQSVVDILVTRPQIQLDLNSVRSLIHQTDDTLSIKPK